jgi:type IV pilus assembly protein PilX
VLIVALIMLVIISLLATFSIRNATSTEAVAGNVRTTQLASQAAEFALNYCTTAMDQLGTPTFALDIAGNTVTIAPLSYQNPARAAYKNGSNLDYWDSATSVAANAVIIVPTTALGGTSTFKRPPECMIEPTPVIQGGTVTYSVSYVITARGFGPEVSPADGTRTRPDGAEVWLQATDD